MTDGASRNNPTTTKTASAVAKRAHASHRPKWQRFQNPPPRPPASDKNGTGTQASLNPYNRQYSHIYARRLETLKPFCLSAAARSDDDGRKNVAVTNRIIELKENVTSIVAGTVVKDVANRPSFDDTPAVAVASDGLSGLAADAEPLRSYCDPNGNDSVVLEDDSGRIELVPSSPNYEEEGGGSDASSQKRRRRLDRGRLVTGAVVAVKGTVRPDAGVMEVEEVYLPDPPPPEEPDVENVEATGASFVDDGGDDEGEDDGPCVVLLSGLHCGADDGGAGASLSLRRDLLLSYLAGRFGAAVGARVCRAIIAGGGCAAPSSTSTSLEDKGGGRRRSVDHDPSLPVRELDLYLSELVASGVPVDCLPGKHDPTDANWPQRPLHPCLLPNATTFGDGRGETMLRRCPNPYEARIGGRTFLGTDGTNLVDLRRYVVTSVAPKDEATTEDDDDKDENGEGPTPCTEMEALSLTLELRHLCPTGPDSLPTFPCAEFDPFVIEETPDVYFAGNCDSFDSQEISCVVEEGGGEETKGRLICVPSFAKTGEVVLVNLKTLGCEVLKFDERVE